MNLVTAYIDTSALQHNLKRIHKLVPNSKLAAVVKANAYGHGLYPVVKTLNQDVDAFAVSRIQEAVSLRNQYISKPILLLEGVYDQDELSLASNFDLHTTVHSLEQIKLIENSHIEKPLKCLLKIDIGMHRLGSSSESEIRELKERLENNNRVLKPVGLISHLSVADCQGEELYNNKQINYFWKIAKDLQFNGVISLANSAGIIRWPESQTQWVRPGIILYGISPFANSTGVDLGLKPVMTLKSTIIAVHNLKKGDRVGYGAAWQAPQDTTLGVVSAGYGDGYPRTVPNGTPVLINGRLVPTAGHVCMDMMFVDLGPDATDKPGDIVTLWGEGLPIEKIAAACGTIPYELVCHIMPRVNTEIISTKA